MSTPTKISPETRRKLLDLIDVIEKVPDEKWDMEEVGEETACGTVGCAAYHYGQARPESGLSVPYLLLNGYPALGKFFGIDDARDIFSPFEYPVQPVTRQHVINRIREIIGPEEK